MSDRLPLSFAVLLTTLYFSQGLPSGFFAQALPALLREEGVSLTYISLAKLLAIPWFLKCFWAPLIDRFGSNRLGHYRGWILGLQSMCLLPLLGLSLLQPHALWSEHFGFFIVVALLINTCMATQDIATDALAVRLLPPRWRGLGNSVQVAGYKLGMLAGGNGLLLLISIVGWSQGFRCIAIVLLVLLIPLIIFQEPTKKDTAKDTIAAAQPASTRESAVFWQEWRALFSLPATHYWLPVLLTYKLADALGSSMIKPMLIDAGYSLSVVGKVGLVSSIAGLLAAFVGGLAYRWLGLWRTLLYGGLLQAIGLGLYALVALKLCPLSGIYAISIFEQMADAVSTVGLFAAMMSYCRPGHEGSDYTVQMAAFMVLSGTVSLASGAIATLTGLPFFFLGSCITGIVCLCFVWRAATAQQHQKDQVRFTRQA